MSLHKFRPIAVLALILFALNFLFYILKFTIFISFAFFKGGASSISVFNLV